MVALVVGALVVVALVVETLVLALKVHVHLSLCWHGAHASAFSKPVDFATTVAFFLLLLFSLHSKHLLAMIDAASSHHHVQWCQSW